MLQFKTTIQKFGKMGEKTGWTYILIPSELAIKLYSKDKKSFRVKGYLDATPIKSMALIPMGEGDYIMPLKADIRKLLRKKQHDELICKLEIDGEEYQMNPELMECLNDDTVAISYFNTFPKSHQKYYSKWVDAAKTEVTKAKRIAKIINAMHIKQPYAEMIRSNSNDKLS